MLFATDGLHAKTPSFLDIMEEKADGPMDEMAMSMMKAAYPVSKDNATVVIVEV